MEIVGEPSGCTPLREEELRGLRLPHIRTRGELDEVENLNIALAKGWIARNFQRGELDQDFMFRLHKEMFSNVWTWAGSKRNHALNNEKFCRPTEIAPRLHQVFFDHRQRVEAQTVSPDYIAARLHHALVLVHPCANGNGRLTREMADIHLMRLGLPQFTWGGTPLGKAGQPRETYLEALHAADAGNYSPLVTFARS